jgi:hypothetical protein
MQILVEIDDKLYNRIKYLEPKADTMLDVLMRSVQNGTPLPKGHGDLIDADEIQFENTEFETYGDYCIAFDAIDTATPIIEADKEANNE